MPDTTKHLVLQMDYNGKRPGEPDNWQWQDAGLQLRGDREQAMMDARAHVKRSGESKFVRGWRVVERTTITSDELVEELTNG